MRHKIRYLTLVVVFSLLIGGNSAVYHTLAGKGQGVAFQPRSPAYVPPWLRVSRLPYIHEDIEVRVRYLPYFTQRWEADGEAMSQAGDVPAIGVVLGAVPTELEIETGGKTPVQVDGVPGWLWHVGPDDLMRPLDREEYSAHLQEMWYDRQIYLAIENWRRRDRFGGPLRGPAIAVQWNKEGTHWVLIASDREPMTEEILLRMANSLIPVEPRSPPERSK